MNAPAIRIIGVPTDSLPVPICEARKPGQKRSLPSHEEGWLNLQPTFPKPVTPGMVAPMGTAKAYAPITTYLDRIAEIEAIAKTQFAELPSMAQEFAANGLSAISLSSSVDDDDLEAANIAEHDTKVTHFGFGKKGIDADGNPIYNDLDDLAALLRRIDWEKYVTACSPATKVYIAVNEQGQMVPACDNRRWTKDQINAYAPKLIAMLNGRTAEELDNDRARAHFYGAPVAAAMQPRERDTFAYRLYVDPSDDNTSRLDFLAQWEGERKDAADGIVGGGPQELGFHGLVSDDPDGDAPRGQTACFEPTEFELWPLSDAEIERGVQPFDSFLSERDAEVSAAWSY